MGHFLFDPEMILAERELSERSNEEWVIYYFDDFISNHFWAKVVRRNLPISNLGRHVAWGNSKIPLGEKLNKKSITERFSTADPYHYLKKTKVHLTFNSEEESLGHEFLKSLGISENDKYICFNVRDNAYQKNVFGNSSTQNEFDPNYHNMRNSNINLYLDAMDRLVSEGYWVFRIGMIAEEKINLNNQRIIDLPNSNLRNSFLDIWIPAHSHLIVTTGSGLDATCQVFRVPCVGVSTIPPSWLSFLSNDTLAIFKHIKDKNGNRLSFKKLTSLGAMDLGNTREFLDRELYFEDNSPKEITNSVMEKLDRMNQVWFDSEEDRINQNMVWKYLMKSKNYSRLHSTPNHLVSSTFLRENPYLLEE
jgi:putative glycosyltransferase (TIGR04372 family)